MQWTANSFLRWSNLISLPSVAINRNLTKKGLPGGSPLGLNSVLAGVDLVIEAFFCQKVLVGALFDDPAVVQD